MTDFVLIHGAYQGGWIWKFVSERLRAKGHTCLPPRSTAAASARHRCAGHHHRDPRRGDRQAAIFPRPDECRAGWHLERWMVMARAAEQSRERVARVVFADALALFDGESILDIVKRPTTAIDTPLARGPSREDAVGRLFATLEPAMREWAADRGRCIQQRCTTSLSSYSG